MDLDYKDYIMTVGVAVAAFLCLNWLMQRQPKNYPPGPLSFPFLGVLPQLIIANKDLAYVLVDWSKKYGKVFSIKVGAMRIVTLNDYDSIQKAMHHPGLQGRPDAGFEFIIDLLDGTKGILADSGPSWKLIRQFYITKFRDFGIGKSSFEDMIGEEAVLLMEEMKNMKAMSFNPHVLLGNAVSNVLNKVALGKRFDYGDPLFKKLHKIVQENMENFGFISIVSMFPVLGYLPLRQKKAIEKNVLEFNSWFSNVIVDHKKTFDGHNIDDLIDAFMKRIKESKGEKSQVFTERKLLATLGDLFFAGTDTTATTLQWAIVYFLRNPDIQKKFQEELDHVVGRSRLPSISDRGNLPYVQATIVEIQRLANIAPVGVSHAAESDVELFGYTIPKGTVITSNLHALMMDPEQWPDPKKFKPDRHLDQDGNFVKPVNFLPFGTGSRQCLGEQLARMELFIFLTHLLHRLTFQLPDGAEIPSNKAVFTFVNKPIPFEVCAIERD